jgi:hypothetical protein
VPKLLFEFVHILEFLQNKHITNLGIDSPILF